MSVRVQLNEAGDLYELGDDVEGVFIPFASQVKTSVDGRIAAVLSNQAAPAAPAAASRSTDEEQGEYRDNGDGTYTRESDGAVGTFGPNGFTVTAQA